MCGETICDTLSVHWKQRETYVRKSVIGPRTEPCGTPERGETNIFLFSFYKRQMRSDCKQMQMLLCVEINVSMTGPFSYGGHVTHTKRTNTP